MTMTSALAENDNPFGLVYEGAIRENVPGKVQLLPVTYKQNGIDIAANIYLPADFDPQRSYAAVVVAHPNGGVKEQVAGLYAQKLAEQGFVTLAADAAFQGASGGEPRHLDIPYQREESIHGMVDFISTYRGVDPERIGILGICGGGGYTIKAAQSDKRLKAVATVSMFNTGRVRRNGYADSQLSSVQERLRKAVAARDEAVRTGRERLVGSMAGVTDEEAAKLPFALYREGFQYYLRSHAHPNSSFEYTESSLMYLMTWDATDGIELINQPLLLIAGSEADSLYMSEEAFEKAVGTADKELYRVKGATHIQTYHVPEYVREISEKLGGFFNKHLHGGEPAAAAPLVLPGVKKELRLVEQGHFPVGGTTLQREGNYDNSVFVGWAEQNETGQSYRGDHAFVEYQIPAGHNKYPLVFIHGYGGSGVCWQMTPDGRDGFATLMLRHRYPTYVMDLPGRGRASRSTTERSGKPVADEMFWFDIWRLGVWPRYNEGVQFPKDSESLDRFFRQMTPDLSDHTLDTGAIHALADKLGDCILVTHSAGAVPGWLCAAQHDGVKGVVAYEPGAYLFPEGEVPPPMDGLTGGTKGIPVPQEDFLKLTQKPIVIYFGDYIPKERVTDLGGENWRVRLQMGREFVKAVNRHGGNATLVELPKIGIRGNTHFLMQDLNNDKLADLLDRWLKEQKLR